MGALSPNDHSRVDEAMKTAHMEELAECDFMQISDGQRQRVMLARAIAQDPRVLVLDEPTSYLDIRYQIDLLRILRHLAKSRNVAVIMSIHELELAQKSADKVICVKDGRVFRAGAPEDIFTRETIGELYGLQHGTFNERFGSVEIGRPHGDAHTFVIAGAGTGSGCVSPAHPAGQGVLRGRSARRGHRLRACARPSGGMRGRARLRADRG